MIQSFIAIGTQMRTILFLAIFLAANSSTFAQGNRGGPDGGRPGMRNGAQRGGAGQGGHPLIRTFDSNGDGIISAAEIQDAAASLAKLDRNRDGQLTSDEILPNGRGQGGQGQSGGPRQPNAQGQFGGQGRPNVQRQLGGQGQPNTQQPRGGQRPQAGNRRGPGQPNGQQGPRLGAQQGPGGPGQSRGGPPQRPGAQMGGQRGAGMGPPNGQQSGQRQQGRRGGRDARFAATVASADVNNDGVITRDELPLHMHAAHKLADANQDDKLDKEEVPAFLAEFGRTKLMPAGAGPIVNRPANPRP